ncbi:hypothetical protein [Nocardioides sp. WS12]|uniref:hypothetical protein n=1 Tax=Nocardioides sp. WS12 TaxID=2486272 RepID=UPI0015FE1A8E|nr:hypothetical protein [Nocardioides sp. WS12]
MLIEIGDFSDLGEAWAKYKGNRRIDDYRDLLRHSDTVDPTHALTPERLPQVVQYYDLTEAELDGYSEGGCWVFRVGPRALTSTDV